jgi:cephalosporin hydroxylase
MVVASGLRRLAREHWPEGLKDRLRALTGGRPALFASRLQYRLHRLIALLRPYPLPGGRSWGSAIGFREQWSIKRGIVEHSWRGVTMRMHPVEVALYPLLFWQVRPRTLIEIGSFTGGNAIFFSDVMKSFGLDCTIISIDVTAPNPAIKPANVEFLSGDSGNLGEALTAQMLRALPRPWLVIENSSHQYEHTLAVLRFFDPLMKCGEYLVVEGANVTDMGDDARFNGGPGRAISEFLRDTGGRYEIDTALCDRFGHNFTGNPNGYLRRVV